MFAGVGQATVARVLCHGLVGGFWLGSFDDCCVRDHGRFVVRVWVWALWVSRFGDMIWFCSRILFWFGLCFGFGVTGSADGANGT